MWTVKKEAVGEVTDYRQPVFVRRKPRRSVATAMTVPFLLFFRDLPRAAIRSDFSTRADFTLGGPGEARERRVSHCIPELPANHEGNGIGLKNARDRLNAAFGADANLDLVFASTVIAKAQMPL